MKKTITTALLFTALAITAQTPDMKLAGNELIKAKKHFYTGALMTMTGSAFSIFAITQDPETLKPVIYMGGVTALIGTILTFESFSHIGKAGVVLNGQNKSLTITPVGASFKMQF